MFPSPHDMEKIEPSEVERLRSGSPDMQRDLWTGAVPKGLALASGVGRDLRSQRGSSSSSPTPGNAGARGGGRQPAQRPSMIAGDASCSPFISRELSYAGTRWLNWVPYAILYPGGVATQQRRAPSTIGARCYCDSGQHKRPWLLPRNNISLVVKPRSQETLGGGARQLSALLDSCLTRLIRSPHLFVWQPTR